MSSEETPERRLRRYCWLTPGITAGDTEMLVKLLAAAEEAGHRRGLEAAAGIAEEYCRQNRVPTDQPSFHAQGRSEAARALAAAIRAAARREGEG
jgi:hypothetical protein